MRTVVILLVGAVVVALGAVADERLDASTAIDGFWFGLSKRSVQFA